MFNSNCADRHVHPRSLNNAFIVQYIKYNTYNVITVKILASLYIKLPTCHKPGLEVIKLEFILKLIIKHNDWLCADTCPHHCALF